MTREERKVTVTSPEFEWLGNSLKPCEPQLLTVLVGKKLTKTMPVLESREETIARILQESREQDIVALFFENIRGKWVVVPVEKIGTDPYLVNEVLASNYFSVLRACETNDEQEHYLRSIGLAIGNQFVGC